MGIWWSHLVSAASPTFWQAGEVVYDAEGFLAKNKDRCPEDVLALLRQSSVPFVQTLFTPSAKAQAQLSRKAAAR